MTLNVWHPVLVSIVGLIAEITPQPLVNMANRTAIEIVAGFKCLLLACCAEGDFRIRTHSAPPSKGSGGQRDAVQDQQREFALQSLRDVDTEQA